MTKRASLWLIIAALASGSAAGARGAPWVEGLDHTPVAVADLDRAAADFARLGFTIKPGRPHTDGIRNRHVKFPNGGEIELITAASPTDALAQDYVDWLKGGEGPAFWSLYSSDLVALTAFLSQQNLGAVNKGDVVTISDFGRPHRLFFADRLRSPTDGPLYWNHPNTAYKLFRVWIADAPADLEVIAKLGAERRQTFACAPFDANAAVYGLPGEGDEVVVAGKVARPSARSVIGVTVLVRSLAAAKAVLASNQITYLQPKSCGGGSLWITPTQAHGLWLELTEADPHRAN